MKKCFSSRFLLSSGMAIALCAFAGSVNADIIVVNDTFGDNDLETNTDGIGTGFAQTAQSNGSSNAEAGGFAVLDGIANGGTRLRITSNDRADTTSLGVASNGETTAGARYLFEDVNISLSSNDGGDGATFRNIIGIRQGGGSGAVDNPGDGLYLAIANDFYTANGTGPTANSFLFLDQGGDRTILETFAFDTLAFADGVPAGADGTVTANPLDIEFSLIDGAYGLEITGDTADGALISFSGNLAVVNNITTGGAFVGTQTESPNVQFQIGRVEVEQFTTAAVPEPSSMVLLGLGAFGFMTRRRRSA